MRPPVEHHDMFQVLNRLELRIGDARRLHTLTEIAVEQILPSEPPPNGERAQVFEVNRSDLSAVHFGLHMMGQEVHSAEDLLEEAFEVWRRDHAPQRRPAAEPSKPCPVEPLAREFGALIASKRDASARVYAILGGDAPYKLAESAAGAILQVQAIAHAVEDLHAICNKTAQDCSEHAADMATERARAALYSIEHVLERLGAVNAADLGSGYALAQWNNPHIPAEEREKLLQERRESTMAA